MRPVVGAAGVLELARELSDLGDQGGGGFEFRRHRRGKTLDLRRPPEALRAGAGSGARLLEPLDGAPQARAPGEVALGAIRKVVRLVDHEDRVLRIRQDDAAAEGEVRQHQVMVRDDHVRVVRRAPGPEERALLEELATVPRTAAMVRRDGAPGVLGHARFPGVELPVPRPRPEAVGHLAVDFLLVRRRIRASGISARFICLPPSPPTRSLRRFGHTYRPRPLASVKLKSSPAWSARSGRSRNTTCSCRATVAVLMTTRLSNAWARGIAARQYAAVLPVPVPASITASRGAAPPNDRATWAIISRCPRRARNSRDASHPRYASWISALRSSFRALGPIHDAEVLPSISRWISPRAVAAALGGQGYARRDRRCPVTTPRLSGFAPQLHCPPADCRKMRSMHLPPRDGGQGHEKCRPDNGVRRRGRSCANGRGAWPGA